MQGALARNGTTERVVLKRVKPRVEVRMRSMGVLSIPDFLSTCIYPQHANSAGFLRLCVRKDGWAAHLLLYAIYQLSASEAREAVLP